jgi:hypothetical protein
MKKILFTIALLLVASAAQAQTRTQLGGTGTSLAGTDDTVLVGNVGGGSFVEEPMTSCNGTNFVRYDPAAAAASRFTCATPGGSGDVTAVGAGCATGDCWTDGLVTAGTTVLVWEGTTADANQITITAPADPASAISLALPTTGGTFAASGTSPVAVSAGGAISVGNAAADGSTKGIASFASADFAASSGNITLLTHTVIDETVGALGTGDCSGTIANTATGAGANKNLVAYFEGYKLEQVATNCCVSCSTCAANEFSVSGTTLCISVDPLASSPDVSVSYLY